MDIFTAVYADSAQQFIAVTEADGTEHRVPTTEGNLHYRELLEWLDADPANVIEPWTDPRSDADRWADDHRLDLAALADIDRRMTPRMIREALLSGNVDAIRALEDEAAPIRAGLPPKPTLPQGPKTAKA